MPPLVLTLLLFAVIGLSLLAFLEIGHRFGRRSRGDEQEDRGISTVEGAVFGLVAFLIAFTFSGAQDRLQARQRAIVDEANAIGTAYLRVDLATPETQTELRELLREYATARVEGAKRLPDVNAAVDVWGKSNETSQRIWALAVEGTADPAKGADRRLLLDAVNLMIDNATAREVAVHIHLPTPILALLIAITGIAALLAGRAMAGNPNRPTLHRITLAFVFAAVLTVLVDLEHPRVGFIRVLAGDSAMQGVLNSMNVAS